MTNDTTATHRDELVGTARVAAAGLIWGTIPLVMRAVDGASIIKVFYRVAFAAVVVFVWMALTGRLGELRLSRQKLLQVTGQGVILTVNWVLFLTALDLTNVATAELLAYTGPVFVAALAPFVTGERFDRRIVIPLALALGGITVIMAPLGLGLSSPRELLGAALAFASALTYATLLLRSKKILRGISGSALMVVEYTLASVLVLPFVVWFYANGQGPSSPGAYAALATLGIVQTAISGLIFLGGLRRIRTDRAAILTYAEPVSAVVFAAVFLGEALTALTLIGGALVVVAGVMVARMDVERGIEPLPLEAAATEDASVEPRDHEGESPSREQTPRTPA